MEVNLKRGSTVLSILRTSTQSMLRHAEAEGIQTSVDLIVCGRLGPLLHGLGQS